jgi:Asp-tRNA(Asn)/Glu-tRNA(Gln) amidotransferase A subunit family amidase
VKDNIATEDKLDVSAGSYALLGAKPAREASVIAKLRDAGVLILGKSNLSEWANFRGLNISSGWSPRGGQTLGAYHPNSQPEGSSSGSAVAAALGLSTAAIGTEVKKNSRPSCCCPETGTNEGLADVGQHLGPCREERRGGAEAESRPRRK